MPNAPKKDAHRKNSCKIEKKATPVTKQEVSGPVENPELRKLAEEIQRRFPDLNMSVEEIENLII